MYSAHILHLPKPRHLAGFVSRKNRIAVSPDASCGGAQSLESPVRELSVVAGRTTPVPAQDGGLAALIPGRLIPASAGPQVRAAPAPYRAHSRKRRGRLNVWAFGVGRSMSLTKSSASVRRSRPRRCPGSGRRRPFAHRRASRPGAFIASMMSLPS